MYQAKQLTVSTRGRGLVDITDEVQRAVKGTGIRDGLCTLFLHHTSASLLISENADPVVQRDLEAFFSRLVKDGDPLFQHDAEGPDDMPAHVRTVLTQVSLTVPVKDGAADLGTWQGVYVWEHRTSPHHRRVTVSVLGG
ncbi:YjbQ family protein [Corallococcus sp. ZKHCc1 1396]|uniref:YjbQ family protein n=1 Tax=Corallococcus soli TaxID=2710757 RepID=A0ABR9PHX6_9BACT|nr:secondary thiamine-phosphate synthase enzyme YjbQ [Corallococcus sp. BB11-1]MBE4747516.1 YjbQ family protein [Corallococcus soli]MCY1031761.1 secondary thiamine-phosphate synthase enzyme YjbQ [Corallococcus sp. BB11-1]